MADARPRVACIVGQTASGKSSAALAVAEALGAEILSVDSMQVYRGFDIGTAKPTAGERARVPHHGLDLVDPTERYSAGAFLDYARTVVADAHARGVPILAVGGTGLYLRAMLYGLGPRAAADPALRARLRAREEAEPGWMARELARLDPDAASRLHPNDAIRIERALEVVLSTGERLSEAHRRHAFSERPFETRVFAIRRDRDELRGRIRARVRAMLDAGWAAEVAGLLAAGVPEHAPAFRALGYRELAAHLRGELDEQALVDRLSTTISRFAKRQATWFNREPSVRWIEPGPDLPDRLLDRIRPFLDVDP